MTKGQKVAHAAADVTWDVAKRAMGVIVALAAAFTAWNTLGWPVPATTEQLAEAQEVTTRAIAKVSGEQKRLHRIVWTDKLLSYQERLDIIDQNIRLSEGRKRKVPPIYYAQKSMLVGQMREAERALKTTGGQ